MVSPIIFVRWGESLENERWPPSGTAASLHGHSILPHHKNFPPWLINILLVAMALGELLASIPGSQHLSWLWSWFTLGFFALFNRSQELQEPNSILQDSAVVLSQAKKKALWTDLCSIQWKFLAKPSWKCHCMPSCRASNTDNFKTLARFLKNHQGSFTIHGSYLSTLQLAWQP